MGLMKKPVFPRIVMLLGLYGAVFMILVVVQFARQGAFTLQWEGLSINGFYQELPKGNLSAGTSDIPGAGEKALSGEVSVSFGGVSFIMGGEEEKVFALDENGERGEIFPEAMIIPDGIKEEGEFRSSESFRFRFSDGSELAFLTRVVEGKAELRIMGSFGEDSYGMELPWKPQKTSGLRDAGDGQIVIIFNGVDYGFRRRSFEDGRKVLVLRTEDPIVAYRPITERSSQGPAEFIISEAREIRDFEDNLEHWRDQNFSLWGRVIADQADEDLVIGFIREGLYRRVYKNSAAAVSAGFRNGEGRTYESSVFLGRMTQAIRSIVAAGRDAQSRLGRRINERSPDFLREPHVFERFAIRDQRDLFNAGAEIVRVLNLRSLSLDLVPGIFEGYLDWINWAPLEKNPFDSLVEPALLLVAQGIRKNSDDSQVFVFQENRGDTEFNLRLGRALLDYAQAPQSPLPQADRETWAGVARSLILSVLSLRDVSGSVPGEVLISWAGKISEGDQLPRISAARLYDILDMGDYRPRAVKLEEGIWAWTAAWDVEALREDFVLDISVSFPAQETHYMLVRGLPPFTKIQLYGRDFRTDPQFENYDSSGWIYSAPDRTLALKMKHREKVEHIRIFFNPPPPPPPPRPVVQESAPPPAPSPVPAAVPSPVPDFSPADSFVPTPVPPPVSPAFSYREYW
jgi:hypothetical protein